MPVKNIYIYACAVICHQFITFQLYKHNSLCTFFNKMQCHVQYAAVQKLFQFIFINTASDNSGFVNSLQQKSKPKYNNGCEL